MRFELQSFHVIVSVYPQSNHNLTAQCYLLEHHSNMIERRWQIVNVNDMTVSKQSTKKNNKNIEDKTKYLRNPITSYSMATAMNFVMFHYTKLHNRIGGYRFVYIYICSNSLLLCCVMGMVSLEVEVKIDLSEWFFQY